jgi:integrase
MPTNTILKVLVGIYLLRRKEMETVVKTSRGIAKAQEVEPIKSTKDINKVKTYLRGKENLRDYMLFCVGINIGLRAGDLLQLRISDVIDSSGKLKESVVITEEKTNKRREFTLNNSAKAAINEYLDSLKTYAADDYLFSSRKGSGSLTVESTHKIIKTTLRELNIKGNYGTHTLRKTFAYHTYINNIKDNPSILETLQKVLNHSSSSVTLRYIGITKEVITDLYANLNL